MSNKRYIRQTTLEEMGTLGQEKLNTAHAVVIGCGGLGSIAAPYLAGAGVGEITLVDGDVPHISNLHRQVFFSEGQSQISKSEALTDHIKKLNSEIKVNAISEMLSKENVERIIQNADIVLECTDDIITKYLVNDACHLASIPMVYGAIYKYDGYVSFFENASKESIHLRDIFSEPDLDLLTCSQVGVLNTIAGMIGLLQANEAIKYISGVGPTLVGSLLSYNVLSNEQLKLKLKKNFYELGPSRASGPEEKIEVSFDNLISNLESYTLISIIERDEELEPIEGSLQMPLSEMDVANWSAPNDKPVVFCCARGRRSLKLCSDILKTQPKAKVLSLNGGLQVIRKAVKA